MVSPFTPETSAVDDAESLSMSASEAVDSIAIASGNMPPVSDIRPATPTLIGLPIELRLEIYACLVTVTHVPIFWPTAEITYETYSFEPIYSAICRQIREEIADNPPDRLVALNSMRIHVGYKLSAPDSEYRVRWLFTIVHEAIEYHLRSLSPSRSPQGAEWYRRMSLEAPVDRFRSWANRATDSFVFPPPRPDEEPEANLRAFLRTTLGRLENRMSVTLVVSLSELGKCLVTVGDHGKPVPRAARMDRWTNDSNKTHGHGRYLRWRFEVFDDDDETEEKAPRFSLFNPFRCTIL